MTMALRDGWRRWACRQVGWLLASASDRIGRGGAQAPNVDRIEGVVGGALPRVNTPSGFRRSLADSLSLAAQSRARDLSIAHRRQVRPEWVLAVSAGLLAATAVVMALALGKRTTVSD